MDDFKNDRWYCTDCPCHPSAPCFATEYDVKTHLVDAHKYPRDDLLRDVHYHLGWRARQVRARAESDAEYAARRMRKAHFGSDYLMPFTVEDFLADFPAHQDVDQ